MKINLQILEGKWNLGYALDLHTISSIPIMDNDGNIIGWDTERTEIGEELYRLKYWHSESFDEKFNHCIKISKVASLFLFKVIEIFRRKIPDFSFDYIIPIPPSKDRDFQPVEELAKNISNLTKIPLKLNTLLKVKSTDELKGIEDINERKKILNNAFYVKPNSLNGKKIVLFDDLFRSGSTLNAATTVLKEKGNVRFIFVLTITKTRSKQ